LTLDQIQPVSAERGQFGPCLTDEAHRPLPACSSRGAATLEPEQVQQRSLRQLYPVASCKTLRSFRTRQRYLLRVDRLPSFRRQMRGLSVDNCLVKVIMFSTLPAMPDRAIDHSINSDIAFGTHWPLPKDKRARLFGTSAKW